MQKTRLTSDSFAHSLDALGARNRDNIVALVHQAGKSELARRAALGLCKLYDLPDELRVKV